jgi:hypothetical protein
VKGRYRLGDVVEDFSCGAGPQGWRYVSHRSASTLGGDSLDLTLDAAGRCVRLLARFDGWEVRGGSVEPDLLWTRGEDEHRAVAAGFTGSSPAFDLATARLLRLEVGESRQLLLVELADPVGAALTVTHAWLRTAGPEDDVSRYEVADLATGDRWVLHLTADALVSREGTQSAHLLELTL